MAVTERTTRMRATFERRLGGGLFSSPLIRQIVRFGIVGGTSYFLNLGTYALFLHLGMHYLVAAATSFLIGFAFNFLANRFWTFTASEGKANAQLARFTVLAAIVLVLDLLLLRLEVEVLGAPAFLAQAIAITVLAPVSFLGNRLWAFAGR